MSTHVPSRGKALLLAVSLSPSLLVSPTVGPYELHAVMGETQVQMVDYKYTPTTLRIEAGITVVWTNRDKDTHNVAVDAGPEQYVSPVLQTGQTARFTFATAGRYHYFCEWHPTMQAEILVTLPDGSVPNAPPIGYRTYAETGKSVRGKFLQYWNKNGALAQQGFPISEELQERSDTDGKVYTVQYFERAVFELHPEKQPPYDVLLSLLGNFEYQRKYPNPNGAPNQQPNTSPGSTLFKETGKRVGGKFLEYWNKNGALAQQGFPISNEFMEKSELDGKTYRVQYFERAVFELHPENKPPYDVLLSQLGKFRYDRVVGSQKPAVSLPSGVHSTGMSSNPQGYPLLAGPHAAPGLNVWIYEHNPQPVISWMGELGSRWALHQLSWYQIEPQKGIYRWDKIDGAVNAMHRAGINVILHPVHSPTWASNAAPGYPNNPDDFGRFMRVVAERYKGKVAGYQIWNEPNLLREGGQYVSASRYAGLLKAGYNAVKAVDPSVVVIAASLTPTGINNPFEAVDDVVFLQRLYGYNSGELKGYFDVLGAHPGSNANPPDTMHPEKPGPGPGWNSHGSFYFRRIEQIRQVMVENGDAHKQMWLTEFGWMSMENPPAGFEYAAQNTEQEQADYIGRAFRMGRDQYPWMGPMLLFQLNFALPNVSIEATDERIGWGILRRDGSKRPSFFAVQQYAKEWNAKK